MSTALIFSGQGSQKPAMGAPWRGTPSWALAERIADRAGVDVPWLLLDADAEALRRTDRAQLATYALEMIVLDALGRVPDLVGCAGHSLGEYAALVAAGIVDLDDATDLVVARGAAMLTAASARPGTMGVVVGPAAQAVVDLTERLRAAGHEVWPANFNACGQTVVSGTAAGVDAVEEAAGSIDGKVIRIPVGGAFHSPLMADAVPVVRAQFSAVRTRTGTVPVVSNVDGHAYDGGADWPSLAARQVVEAVQWEACVRTLVDTLGARRLVEIGPARVLTGMVRRIVPDLAAHPVNSPADLTTAG